MTVPPPNTHLRFAFQTRPSAVRFSHLHSTHTAPCACNTSRRNVQDGLKGAPTASFREWPVDHVNYPFSLACVGRMEEERRRRGGSDYSSKERRGVTPHQGEKSVKSFPLPLNLALCLTSFIHLRSWS